MKHALALLLAAAIAAPAAHAFDASRYKPGSGGPHVAAPFPPPHENKIQAMIPVDRSHPVNCRTVTYTRPAGAIGPDSKATTFSPTVCDRGE